MRYMSQHALKVFALNIFATCIIKTTIIIFSKKLNKNEFLQNSSIYIRVFFSEQKMQEIKYLLSKIISGRILLSQKMGYRKPVHIYICGSIVLSSDLCNIAYSWISASALIFTVSKNLTN